MFDLDQPLLAVLNSAALPDAQLAQMDLGQTSPELPSGEPAPTAPAEAQPGSQAPGPQAAPPKGLLQQPLLFLLFMMVMMYLFVFLGRGKKQKQFDDMLRNLKKNDRVVTIGGILGTVVATKDDEVVLKVDEGTNTKMTFVRKAIQRVLPDSEKKP